MIKQRYAHFFILFVYVILITVVVIPCSAKDKNGVSPNTISLPSGPGSIEGLGDAFQPMLNTGSSRYSVNIAVPAGTAGHTPEFSLQYDSGLGDGPAGIGWSAEPGSISRQVDKGIPRYVDSNNGRDDDHDGTVDEPDERDTFLGPDGEELVEVEQNVYRARIEGSFVRYRRVDDSWQADLKDGSRLEFGETDDARIVDPADATRIYRWLLSKSIDVNGNTIEYSYAAIAGSDSRKYISEIRYGPGSSPWPVFYFIKFSYEERPDWRKDFRSSFLVRTAHRLKQIDIGIQGAAPAQCAQGDWNDDTIGDALIIRYVLAYTHAFPNVSQLIRVTRFGSDGVNFLPPIRFSYASASPARTFSAAEEIIVSENTPPAVMDNELVELVDLNRDGLADILQTDFTGSFHHCYLNLGTDEEDRRRIEWADGKIMESEDGLALRLHLAEDRVSLADMNGDGIADLVHTTEADEVYYYANTGNLLWSERKRMSIRDSAPPAPFGSKEVITADIDFDKRIDVIRSSENGYTLWFNRADGQYSSRVLSDGVDYLGQVILFSDPGVQTADMNGDRLPDVVKVKQNVVLYGANMGHGNYAPTVSVPIPDMVLTDGENSQISRAKMTDINGDGLADLVIERAVANELWFWLNLGTDTLSDRYVVTDMPGIVGSNTVIRWADMNGNSTTDLIYADSTAGERLRILDIGEMVGGSAHPNLLNRIENGLGMTTDIFYKSSTDFYLQDLRAETPWTTTVPFPVQVVSHVETRTSLDLDDVAGPDVYIKNFHYRNGFYEDQEKQFRGFAEVLVTAQGDATAPTSVNAHSFFTGGPDMIDNDGDNIIDEVSSQNHREEDALKGMVRSLSLSSEDGTLFNRQENSWAVRNLLVNQDGIEIRYAYKEQSENFIHEGQATPEILRTTFTYDEYGNVMEEKNYGALSISGDEVFSYSQYINNSAEWLLGFPQRQYLTDNSEVKVAETLNYYDGNAFVGLSAGTLTKGQLTRQQGWVNGTHYINLIRNSFDAYGNITSILDPNGNRRNVEYDPELHLFPLLETIEVGGGTPDLQVQATYNIGLGVVTSSLDFNGHQTIYNYDTFGRPTSFIQPGDSASYPTQSFSYAMADPQNSLLYSYDSSGTLSLTSSSVLASSVISRSREVSGEPGTIDTIQYVDSMGRKLAQVSEGEFGFIVNRAVRFNGMGSPRYGYLPYAAARADYVPPTRGGSAAETQYDAAGRGIRMISLPDDNGILAVETVSFAPLSQSITDGNGISKDLVSNGLKQLIRVQEHNQGATYRTGYQYDTLGNLIRIEDAHNNIKSMAYDGLKRKTSMDDPDKGHIEYEYDDAGNLIRTMDNKQQVVEYSYDGAGRLISQDFLDSAGISPDVELHYDLPSADYPQAENLKGKLAWLHDLSGGQYVSYDQRGNPLWTINRINDNGAVQDFRTALEYDAMGRVTATVYPDNYRLEYAYNSRGSLHSIPGIIDSVSYKVSGARSEVQYHNGITTTYNYDPRERLKQLTAIPSLDPFTPIQNLSYTFDQVNNITDITDHRSLPVDSPANGSQHFQYDDLYRLIQTQGPGYGRINFGYDAIGNMISKNSPAVPDLNHVDDALINLGVMSYGAAAGTNNRSVRLPGAAPGPHAVTATESGLAYDYDDNGNMISHGEGDIYEWDFKDRLLQVSTADSVSSYVYDHGDQRVIKRVTADGSTETTYYVNDSFEVRNNKQVKFVFDGSQRVARIEDHPLSSEQAAEQAIDLQTGWNFFSLVLEPDNPAVTEVLSGIADQFSELWLYNAVSQQYMGYVPGEGLNDITELHGQIGYLIRMHAPSTLMVSGTRMTGAIDLQTGWNLIASPTEAPLSAAETLAFISGQYEGIWGYTTAVGTWRSYQPDQPDFLNTLEYVHPARAYWLKMDNPAQLPFLPQPLKIYYYHPDHLGSSSLVTDETGTVVERTQYYPFGRPRHEERTGFESAYKYTGKELDKSTGLMYYEARYYDPVVGRFVSVDPLMTFGTQGDLLEQAAYAYCVANPIVCSDPTGLAPTVPKRLQRRISTPVTDYAQHITNVSSSRVKLRIKSGNDHLTVTIKKDKFTTVPGRRGATSISIKINVGTMRPRYKNGIVTSFSRGKMTVFPIIQTSYEKGARPYMPSKYGRGTTKQDKGSGNTTLRFHEGRHGIDYITYLKNNPLSFTAQFKGKIGMTKRKFVNAWNQYKRKLTDERNTYKRNMRQHTINNTDCTGTKKVGCQ